LEDKTEILMREFKKLITAFQEQKMTGNVAIKVNFLEGGVTNYNKFVEESCRFKK